MARKLASRLLFGATLALAGSAARAQDTGVIEALPVAVTAGTAPAPRADWPPDDLGEVTLPENPSMRVRSPAASVQSDTFAGARVSVRYAWPVWAEKGYLPMHVEVSEQRGKNLQLWMDFSLRSSMPDRVVRLPVAVERGAKVERDVLLPAFENGQSVWELRPEDLSGAAIYGLGAVQWVSGVEASALILTPSLPPLGTLERWTAATPGVLVSTALFEDMPQGAAMAAAYTSLDVAVIDTSEGLPDAARLAPLLAWVRLGGTLLLAGPEQPWPPELSSWMEQRFELDPSVMGEGVPAWAMGLGALVRGPGGPFDQPGAAGALYTAAIRGAPFSAVPDPSTPNRVTGMRPELADVGELPRGALGLLLIGLAALMGPVNLLAVRRLGQPPLLLVTTPVLALLTSLGLVAWGVTRDGFGVQWSGESLTVLDQRARTSSGVEARLMFTGRSLAGLRPGAGTILFPGAGDREGNWMIDLGEGALWTGNRVLPTRQRVRHTLLTDRETSRRLDVVWGPAGPTVSNHLGAAVETLVLRGDDGRTWAHGARIADGATAELREELPDWDVERQLSAFGSIPSLTFREGVRPGWPGWLPARTYLARIDGAPFRDDLGLVGEDVGSRAVVLGVLEVAP